jgi:hypothetical protein
MTESEILGDRIEKVKRRYKEALDEAISILKWEQKATDSETYWKVNSSRIT